MAKYILNPSYGDMSVVILGSSVKTVKKNLLKFWEDELDTPEDYDEDYIKNIHIILNEEYSCIEDLMEDYNKLIDNDYSFEESY